MITNYIIPSCLLWSVIEIQTRESPVGTKENNVFPHSFGLWANQLFLPKTKLTESLRKWSDQWMIRAEMEAEMDRSASSNSSEPPLFDTIVVLDRQVRKIHFNINMLF